MKKVRMSVVLIAMFLTMGLIVSCEKDNKENNETGIDPVSYPKTLSYDGYTIKEMRLYTGSPDGGIRQTDFTIDIDRARWLNYLREDDEYFKTCDYTFLNGSQLKWRVDTFNYKFRDNSLYLVYNEGEEKTAYGSKNELQKEYGFYKVKIESLEKYSSGSRASDVVLEDILEESDFTLVDMIGETDTIMWCNVRYVWK